MTGLQIAMIVIGMVCLIGSFFVSEKLSKADLEEMKKMSEQEIKVILDARMQDASTQIDEKIQDKVEDAVAQIERGGEKETNEKILAISEYSDTVLTSMNKSHDEIVFLYDMLNDKQERVTELMKELTLMQSAVAQVAGDRCFYGRGGRDLRGRNGVAGRKADFFRRCFPFTGSHRG